MPQCGSQGRPSGAGRKSVSSRDLSLQGVVSRRLSGHRACRHEESWPELAQTAKGADNSWNHPTTRRVIWELSGMASIREDLEADEPQRQAMALLQVHLDCLPTTSSHKQSCAPMWRCLIGQLPPSIGCACAVILTLFFVVTAYA